MTSLCLHFSDSFFVLTSPDKNSKFTYVACLSRFQTSSDKNGRENAFVSKVHTRWKVFIHVCPRTELELK